MLSAEDLGSGLSEEDDAIQSQESNIRLFNNLIQFKFQ